MMSFNKYPLIFLSNGLCQSMIIETCPCLWIIMFINAKFFLSLAHFLDLYVTKMKN